jgi:hypothetical protein
MLTKIGITGKIGAGKDHVAGLLIANHGFEIFRNAGALKDMTRSYLRYRGVPVSMVERFIEGDLKEQPHEVFDGKSCREFMQWLGSSGRNHFHLDIWVNSSGDHGYPEKAVCTDVRYDNEAIALKQRGFRIWQKEGRPGKDRSGEIHQHESEAGISRELVDDFIPYIQDEQMLKVYLDDLLYKYEIAPETFGSLR